MGIESLRSRRRFFYTIPRFPGFQLSECMRFINDRNPLPLLDQLRQRFGEKLGIEYRQRETGSITIEFHVLG